MRCLCICNHHTFHADQPSLIAKCGNCGRVWKWINGTNANDWTMIAGPTTKPAGPSTDSVKGV
jgi:hypothetical protein